MKLSRAVLAELDEPGYRRLVRRSAVPDPAVRATVRSIVAAVAAGGDAALTEASDRFGGGRPQSLLVEGDEMEAALASLPDELRTALERSAANIRTFHETQLPSSSTVEVEPGVSITREWTPLHRVGAYVPGGTAAYPSSLLMTVVPARVAGVRQIAVASPAGNDGSVSPVLLAAAAVARVDELYIMGGAQAIAALAFGTETIAPVQKIVGPGNPWVTAAKLEVYGSCDIDLPAGPSEVLVLADSSSDPRTVAADLLCQTEHGPDSPAVLVTTDPTVADRVENELDRLLPQLERRAVLAKALSDHGLVVIVGNEDEAVAFANDYAAEHVSVATADPRATAARLQGAGSVYVGHWSPESAGDYATGANHVLPTGGLAGSADPLSVEDFGSWRQIQELTPGGLESLRPVIAALADAEGLAAHRLAADIRFEEGPS